MVTAEPATTIRQASRRVAGALKLPGSRDTLDKIMAKKHTLHISSDQAAVTA